MRYRALVLSLAVSTLLGGCASKKPKPGVLEPLSAPSWRADLPVPGFGAASVALPLGATKQKPIVVVLHGAHDRAEWQCGSFRGVVGNGAFIVCPAGQAAGDNLYGTGSFDDSRAELRAALAALKARYANYVAPSPIVLIGYAEGAAVAADLARQEPSFFARVALVAGDPTALSSTAATIFGQGGGKRVLFFCTTSECDARGVERSVWLTRAGATAKSVLRPVGPYLDQAFTELLKGEMPWLLEGDARFVHSRR